MFSYEIVLKDKPKNLKGHGTFKYSNSNSKLKKKKNKEIQFEQK